MLCALILLPLLAGLGAFMIRRDQARRALLVATAVAHLGLVSGAWLLQRPYPALFDWLVLDAPGLLFLSLASLLFLAASLYGVHYLAHDTHEPQRRFIDESMIIKTPEAILIGCMLFFLGMMSLVCLSNHLGLLWVALEATTLASAPLIYYHRNARSLEAAWKYLLICSIGIALALNGNFLLTVATMSQHGHETPLLLSHLVAAGPRLHPLWLKAAFIFILVGYGTKMGLAPLHTWLPDAHSESPSIISALLSGALLNCAFLGILRTHQICVAAGMGDFSRDLLVLFGLISMGVAAVFIIGQVDYKRMLAYSSVEHMGILALGIGLGGAAGTFGALLHAINHSLTKAMLFLVAGNILAVYQTKSTTAVRGLTRVLPISGALWLAGFLSITGSPPFGTFFSEFLILKAALDQGRWAVGGLYLFLLALVFIGMATIVLRMAQGTPEPIGTRPAPSAAGAGEKLLSIAPPAVLGALVLMLGVYLPGFLGALLRDAATIMVGGK